MSETSHPAASVDLRGRMFRAKRQMPDEEAREFLRARMTAHVGSVDSNGWPYVVPLVYIYEGGDVLYLHTGAHQGHCLTNVQHDPRICIAVSDIGLLHQGKRFACDSALVYSSVIVFGAVRILYHDREKKSWFLDRLLEKHGDPRWEFEPGYSLLDRIILYEQKIEMLTGKRGPEPLKPLRVSRFAYGTSAEANSKAHWQFKTFGMTIALFEVKGWERDYLQPRLPEHELLFSHDTIGPAAPANLSGVEILSTFIYSQISAEVITAMPELKLIATRSTGFDHIDLAACAARGIVVSNVPSYGENTVAEHTFALMLGLSRKIPQSYARGREGNYSLEGLTGFDLKDKTLGVVGAGKIGLHVIKIARGFGMEVLAHDAMHNSFLAELLGYRYVAIEELLGSSDVVTLHMPFAPELYHFMDRDKFALMKPGALFINTARGRLVDTNALLAALESGRLAGAGLDVVEGEELIQEERQLLDEQQNIERLQAVLRTHVLFRRENVLFTPHNAFNSREALQRILDTTVDNIHGWEHGRPANVVAGQQQLRSAA